MTVCLDGSRPARTVRTDTVLPAPTSPVTTPMERSLMHQEMRATPSLWEVCRCSMPGARSRPNGVRLNPDSLNLINSMAGWQGLLSGFPRLRVAEVVCGEGGGGGGVFVHRCLLAVSGVFYVRR